MQRSARYNLLQNHLTESSYSRLKDVLYAEPAKFSTKPNCPEMGVQHTVHAVGRLTASLDSWLKDFPATTLIYAELQKFFA